MFHVKHVIRDAPQDEPKSSGRSSPDDLNRDFTGVRATHVYDDARRDGTTVKGVPGSRSPVSRGGAIWTGDELPLWNRLSADGARAVALHSSVDRQWV